MAITAAAKNAINSARAKAAEAKASGSAKRVHPALKIPKSLAACADLLYATKAKRLMEGSAVKELAEDEAKIKNHLIDNLPKGDASGVAGKVARVTIIKEPIPRIADEKKLWAAIKKNPKKWGAIQARPSIDMAVLKQLFDEDKIPPGVETFNIIKVSLNKV